MKSLRQTLLASALWAILLTPVAPLFAANEAAVEKIVSSGRENSQVMEHLDHLVNRIGPRLTSSDNLQNAAEWARDRFKSFGLEARLEEWGEFPVGFNRGPWSGRVIGPEPKELEFGTNAWTAGTRGVTRGRAVLAPQNEEQLSAVRDKLHGAWVLGSAPTPGGRGARGGGRGELLAPATAPTAEFRRKLDAAYTEAKIAGFVQPTRSDLIVTGGSYRVSWDKLPTTPQVNLVRKQYDEIAGWLRDGKEVTLEFDIRNYFRKGPIKLYNVIADIPGTEKPDEFVIVGGHLDSWDGATGTTDNGTGCATAMEAARILMASGLKPRRTIRFMLWSGEEEGLLGSAAYCRAHPELMPKISAVLVHDGGTNYLSGINSTDAMLSDLEEVFAQVKTLNKDLPFAVRKVTGLTGGGSDHASFLAAGVPGFFWNQAGRANYTHTHHTQYDTFDTAIADYQKHSSIVIAIGAYGIADLDHLLSREKMQAPGGRGGRGGGRGAPGSRLLGVQLEDDGLTIGYVEAASVADRAGVKVGDVLLAVDGNKVADRPALTQALQAGPAKKKLLVRRDSKEVELTADWGDRP